MMNLTQTSSSLSPVQEFYEWYAIFEAERKATKQKKRRGYFFEENEKAIIMNQITIYVIKSTPSTFINPL